MLREDRPTTYMNPEYRLDTIICNAGISAMILAVLSEDGFERTFAPSRFGLYHFRERVRM